uniref:Uncharacterized protein n=1 Tax=Arundo donax TaxID=35708 RepID=A0A0A8YLY9_ARUDO
MQLESRRRVALLLYGLQRRSSRPAPAAAQPLLELLDLRRGLRVVNGHLVQLRHPRPRRVLLHPNGSGGGGGLQEDLGRCYDGSYLGRGSGRRRRPPSRPRLLPAGDHRCGQERHVGGRRGSAQALHGERGVKDPALELLIRPEGLDPPPGPQRASVRQEVARRLEHQLGRRRRERHLPHSPVGEHNPGAPSLAVRRRHRARREVTHGARCPRREER